MRRLRSPARVELALTSRCNLRCGYCHFFDSSNAVAEELSTAEWLKVIEELSAMQVMFVTLSGGEALLRPDFPELIRGVVRSRMRFYLLSNGTLLDEGVARLLRDSGRCSGVQISLDGLRPENDLARGAGSFDRSIRALEMLTRYEIPCSVRMTIGRHNLGKLEPAVRFLVETMRVARINSNFAINFAGWSGEADQHLSMREQLESVVEHKRVQEKFPESFVLTESIIGHMLYCWPRLARLQRTGAPAALRSRPACPAPAKKLAIRADGAILPCNHLPELVLGSVRTDSIQDIWDRSPILEQLIRSVSRRTAEFRKCADCRFSLHCLPACPAAVSPDDADERANSACLKLYMEAAPDFDFEKMQWSMVC